MTLASIKSMLSTLSQSKETPAWLMIQAEECTTQQCGTDPDGNKQGSMINPADCDDYNNCNGDFECQTEFTFCAEDLKLIKPFCSRNMSVPVLRMMVSAVTKTNNVLS
jgi:hypothetical protein